MTGIASAAVKAGSACSKAGAISIYAGKKYTCIKSGKKLVWDIGVAIPKPVPSISPTPESTPAASPSPSPSPTSTTKPIDPTKSVEGKSCSPIMDAEDRVGYSSNFQKLVVLHCLNEGRWFDFGKQYPITVNQETGKVESGIQFANFGFHYQSTVASQVTPKTSGPSTQGNANIESCKISQIDPNGLHKGFNWTDWVNFKAFSPNMTIQVIPLQASDSTSNGDPNSDYSAFIDETKQFIFNLSDGKFTINFKSPHSYLQLPKSFASYKVGVNDYANDARTPGQEALIRDALAISSASDINAATLIMLVAPPSTSNQLFVRFSNTYPISFGTKSHIKAFSIIASDPAWGTVHHDFYHLAMSVPDHYGDESSNGKDVNQLIGTTGEILGTDRWGNLSGTKMDWLGWDKWLAGLLQDSQVMCASIASSETFWIKPSAVFGVSSKLLIIPTGKYTAIAVESMRNVGYNNLLPKDLMGAIVYSIDLTKTVYGTGFNIIRPKDRINASSNYPLPGDDALRVGDSVIFGGYKISIVEAGDFGDVVKVEKVS